MGRDNYYVTNSPLGYIRLLNSGIYWYSVIHEENDMLFEVVCNFPVKHWWQKVVKEIVEC